MKYDKSFLMDLVKFYAVIGLIPTALLAPYFEPKYWIAVYPGVLTVLVAISWAVNLLLDSLGWPKVPVVRQVRRRARVVRKKKVR